MQITTTNVCESLTLSVIGTLGQHVCRLLLTLESLQLRLDLRQVLESLLGL